MKTRAGAKQVSLLRQRHAPIADAFVVVGERFEAAGDPWLIDVGPRMFGWLRAVTVPRLRHGADAVGHAQTSRTM